MQNSSSYSTSFSIDKVSDINMVFFSRVAITVFPILSLVPLLNVLQRTGTGRFMSAKGRLFFVNMRVWTGRNLGVHRSGFRHRIVLRSQENMACFGYYQFWCTDLGKHRRTPLYMELLSAAKITDRWFFFLLLIFVILKEHCRCLKQKAGVSKTFVSSLDP